MSEKITREQYMQDSSKLHHEYYLQFATPTIRWFVESNYKKEFIKECLTNDEHLNNLGKDWLCEFDSFGEVIGKTEIARVNREINGNSVWSYSDVTCAIKAYMREWIKE